ncbi:MAG TPA: GNAT family N-acetyltransferase [Candidatus Methylacidiphilales bacterium]|nr:GNAT family N-acetyltransferase [Candidatus Methylacidiphilales bacterium]
MVLLLRRATLSDLELLGSLNQQLIEDEGHRSAFTLSQLSERMRGWITVEYTAMLFEYKGEIVGYALYRDEPGLISVRQFFVRRDRRRKSLGRKAFDLLRKQIWPAGRRITVEVLTANETAVAFWKAVGFKEYALSLEIFPSTAP